MIAATPNQQPQCYVNVFLRVRPLLPDEDYKEESVKVEEQVT